MGLWGVWDENPQILGFWLDSWIPFISLMFCSPFVVLLSFCYGFKPQKVWRTLVLVWYGFGVEIFGIFGVPQVCRSNGRKHSLNWQIVRFGFLAQCANGHSQEFARIRRISQEFAKVCKAVCMQEFAGVCRGSNSWCVFPVKLCLIPYVFLPQPSIVFGHD